MCIGPVSPALHPVLRPVCSRPAQALLSVSLAQRHDRRSRTRLSSSSLEYVNRRAVSLRLQSGPGAQEPAAARAGRDAAGPSAGGGVAARLRGGGGEERNVRVGVADETPPLRRNLAGETRPS
ncbi:unnamed protein product [Boreogadus saida]